MHNNEETNPFYIGIPVIIIVALIIAILIGEESKRRGENKCNCNCPACMEKHGGGNKSKPIFYPLFLNTKLK